MHDENKYLNDLIKLLKHVEREKHLLFFFFSQEEPLHTLEELTSVPFVVNQV